MSDEIGNRQEPVDRESRGGLSHLPPKSTEKNPMPSPSMPARAGEGVSSPKVNGGNGRGPGGRFAKGNAGGPGNPHVRRTALIRAILLKSLTRDKAQAIANKLIEMAEAGDLAAIKEILDRTIGKAVPSELLERIEVIEHLLENHHGQH